MLTMRSSTAVAIALLQAVAAVPIAQQSTSTATATVLTSASFSDAPLKSGNPFSFPLSNGFDGTLTGDALASTNVQAQGTEPNGGAPILSTDDLTSVQLIAFNEVFEVAFFTSLLTNITNNVEGFVVPEDDLSKPAFRAIQAQEELHTDLANAILKANNRSVIQPCQYTFPTSNLPSALALAKTFTDVVLGTLQDVQQHLAINGAAAVVPIIGSVIGQEGEQNGYFRQSGNLIPSSQPFLTRSTREFAYSALNQIFVVPGSCPNSKDIDLPIFAALSITTPNITAADQVLSFAVSDQDVTSCDGMSIVFLNGQNTPLVQPISNVASANGVTTFDAEFPYSENLLNGLTIAALVNGAGPFASAAAVAAATVAGPGLIEVN